MNEPRRNLTLNNVSAKQLFLICRKPFHWFGNILRGELKARGVLTHGGIFAKRPVEILLRFAISPKHRFMRSHEERYVMGGDR